jgi:putative transposase
MVLKLNKEKPMTHHEEYALPQDLTEKGLETVLVLLCILISQVMQADRSEYLDADHYEPTENQKEHANGFKPKTVHTQLVGGYQLRYPVCA